MDRSCGRGMGCEGNKLQMILVLYGNEAAGYCQIGTQYPIVNVKEDQAYPVYCASRETLRDTAPTNHFSRSESR
jgi:hypothetical protein